MGQDAAVESKFSRTEVLADLAHLSALRDQVKLDPTNKLAAARHKREVQRFAARHQGLAFDMAHRYARHNIPQHDLRQTAMIGLLEAIARWEPTRATCFSSFATFRMRHEIQELLRKQLPMVRCSELVHKDQAKITKARRILAPAELTPEQLTKLTGLSARRIKAALETDTRDLGHKPLPTHVNLDDVDVHGYEDRLVDALDARRSGTVEKAFAAVAAELPRPRKRLR